MYGRTARVPHMGGGYPFCRKTRKNHADIDLPYEKSKSQKPFCSLPPQSQFNFTVKHFKPRWKLSIPSPKTCRPPPIFSWGGTMTHRCRRREAKTRGGGGAIKFCRSFPYIPCSFHYLPPPLFFSDPRSKSNDDDYKDPCPIHWDREKADFCFSCGGNRENVFQGPKK